MRMKLARMYTSNNHSDAARLRDQVHVLICPYMSLYVPICS